MPGTTEALVKSAAYDGQFFTFGRWRSSKFAVKKLPVGDSPKPVWHLPQSTLYITPFGFTRKMCAKKSVWTYITRWSQNYYWVKKVCWLFISWVTVTQLLKGARAPWLLIPQAEIEPAPPNLQKQFVYFTGMPGDEFFSRSGSTMEKAQVQFCRLEFDVDKRVEGKCLLLARVGFE